MKACEFEQITTVHPDFGTSVQVLRDDDAVGHDLEDDFYTETPGFTTTLVTFQDGDLPVGPWAWGLNPNGSPAPSAVHLESAIVSQETLDSGKGTSLSGGSGETFFETGDEEIGADLSGPLAGIATNLVHTFAPERPQHAVVTAEDSESTDSITPPDSTQQIVPAMGLTGSAVTLAETTLSTAGEGLINALGEGTSTEVTQDNDDGNNNQNNAGLENEGSGDEAAGNDGEAAPNRTLMDNIELAVPFGIGFLKGVFQDGLGGLAETSWSIAKFVLKNPMALFSPGQFLISKSIEAAVELTPKLFDLYDEIKDKLEKAGPFGQALATDLDALVDKVGIDGLARILTDNATESDKYKLAGWGQELQPLTKILLSESAAGAVDAGVGLLGLMEAIKKELTDLSDDQVAELIGRITGMLAFEAALGSVITGLTAGAGSAAVAARVVDKLRKIDNIPGLDRLLKSPALRAKLQATLTRLADRIEAISKKSQENGGLLDGPLDEGLTRVILQQTCFTAGTPVLTPGGAKPIESFAVGDSVLARDELVPEGDVRAQRVEAVFELSAPVIELHAGGQTIETTGEHPFYVDGRGWVPAENLQVGDQLVGHNEVRTAVESVVHTERESTVYNLRVSNDHTYFVGEQSWGFSLWVHNTYTAKQRPNGKFGILDEEGEWIKNKQTDEIIEFDSEADAVAHIESLAPKVTPDDLHAFGNKTSPRAPRADYDLGVDELSDIVPGQSPPLPRHDDRTKTTLAIGRFRGSQYSLPPFSVCL